jgi:DNA-binding transcriptional LysR family regulator
MPPVNLKLLHIFIAVAENKSFRQASEQLNRSQSAVSMQIRQLEEQVGVALFHRTTRRVELSSEGEQLLTHARRAIEEWDNGLRQIRDIVDIQRGTLSIGCVPTVAATILPRALNVFQKAYPGININLRELAAHDLLDSVRRREIDFGIGPIVNASTELHFDPIFDDPIYALAARRFALPKRQTVDLAELCAFPILLNAKSTALRTELDRALAIHSLTMTIKFEVVHTQHTDRARNRRDGGRHSAKDCAASFAKINHASPADINPDPGAFDWHPGLASAIVFASGARAHQNRAEDFSSSKRERFRIISRYLRSGHCPNDAVPMGYRNGFNARPRT